MPETDLDTREDEPCQTEKLTECEVEANPEKTLKRNSTSRRITDKTMDVSISKCLNIQTDNRDQRIEKEEINRFLCDEDEEEDSGDEDFDEDKLDQMEDTVKVSIYKV